MTGIVMTKNLKAFDWRLKVVWEPLSLLLH